MGLIYKSSRIVFWSRIGISINRQTMRFATELLTDAGRLSKKWGSHLRCDIALAYPALWRSCKSTAPMIIRLAFDRDRGQVRASDRHEIIESQRVTTRGILRTLLMWRLGPDSQTIRARKSRTSAPWLEQDSQPEPTSS